MCIRDSLLSVSPVSDVLASFPYGREAAQLKLRREFTGLGYRPETSLEGILEYVRARRGALGGTAPLYADEEKPAQLCLMDADGKKWTAETDGGVVELRDESGRTPQVFETKTAWFKADELDRMQLALASLQANGVRPSYRYGGGHIQVKLKGYFEKHPVQLASFINLMLTHEPILVHLMTHQRRQENARPLSIERPPGETTGPTLAQRLGHGLNGLLQNPDSDCRSDAALRSHFTREFREGQTVQETCLLAFIARFGIEIVGDRTFAINLQSWRGAASPLKLHDSVEFRLFNAPKNARDAELEERLVRVMADAAIRSPSAILYEEKFDRVYDLDSYYTAYFPAERDAQFGGLLRRIGMSAADIALYASEYLDPAQHALRRYSDLP